MSEKSQVGQIVWHELTVGDASVETCKEMGGEFTDGPRKMDGADFYAVHETAGAVPACCRSR